MSARQPTSRYVLYVSNVSGNTPTSEIRDEFQKCAGRVYDCERDYKTRSLLIEMNRADDAKYAWRKMDGFYLDGREWKVDYANPSDFKFFGWKWTEGGTETKTKESPRSQSRYSTSPAYTNVNHSTF